MIAIVPMIALQLQAEGARFPGSDVIRDDRAEVGEVLERAGGAA